MPESDLPAMGGCALAEAIRQRRPHTQVLLLAGANANEGDAALQKWPVLPQPYRLHDRARAVRDAIDAGKTGEEEREQPPEASEGAGHTDARGRR